MRHPEITWSLMHPTMIDPGYMKRIVREAERYDADSFEICGAFGSPAGGLNGLLLFEPYPHAAAKCDADRVRKTRADLNEIVSLAKASGRPLYLWHREIMMPAGMLEDRPSLLDPDGEFDLLGRDFEEFLRYKIDNAFRVVPDLAGIVLTLTEADYSVIHNSRPDRYPPDAVVEKIVRLFAEEHRKRGKTFILRSFGSVAPDYEDILRGARAAAKDYEFEIETKITPYDFSPFLPVNPFLKRQEGTRLAAECDGLGEYLGAGYLPAANVDCIARYVAEGRAAGVSRYAIRLDRIGNNIFDCHEVNLYAYHRLIRGEGVTADQIYREWAETHWARCPEEMIHLSRKGMEAVKKTNFLCGNVVFHKFPIEADFRWVAAGGAIGVYPNGVPLRQLRGEWGILSDNDSPGRDRIRAEKAEALSLAQKGLAELRNLKDRLDPAEYGRLERVWRILNIVVRGISAFTEAMCCFFDDLEASAKEPLRLRRAVAEAETVFNELLTDTSDALPEQKSLCDGGSLPGDDLDRVYLKGLRHLCRTLEAEYRAEFDLREKWSSPLVRDLVLPGSFGDQYRIFRYMHASHSRLENGIPVRYAGNPVFPNGFVEVELKSEAGAVLEIGIVPGSAEKLRLTVDGTASVLPVPADGLLRVPASPAGKMTVRVEKSGRDYPCLYMMRTVKKS